MMYFSFYLDTVVVKIYGKLVYLQLAYLVKPASHLWSNLVFQLVSLVFIGFSKSIWSAFPPLLVKSVPFYISLCNKGDIEILSIQTQLDIHKISNIKVSVSIRRAVKYFQTKFPKTQFRNKKIYILQDFLSAMTGKIGELCFDELEFFVFAVWLIRTTQLFIFRKLAFSES